MGVINNLIEIRRKFRAIVGANWDGVTISDIMDNVPLPKFVVQPSDTDGNAAYIESNLIGFTVTLLTINESGELSVVSTNNSENTSASLQVPLNAITNTSRCIMRMRGYGHSRNSYTDSNVFTVTRTAAQTASASPKSKGADIFTETTESIDVVKENIEKE